MCDVRTCEIHWTVIITPLAEPHYCKDRVIQQQTVWHGMVTRYHNVMWPHHRKPHCLLLYNTVLAILELLGKEEW